MDAASLSPDALCTRARQLFANLEAALFDLDNTLIETHIDFPKMKRSVLMLAENRGVDTATLEELDILSGVEAATTFLKEKEGDAAGTRFRDDAFALLADIERAECANPIELPGASDLLAWLHTREVPIAIVTRNCRAVSLELIARGHMHCDALLAREDVVRTKPHPEHLHAAQNTLARLFPHAALTPANSLMVGDHWMDIAAGRAAGMQTIGLRRGRAPEDFAPAFPDLLVRDMAELWSLVRDTARS